METLPAVLTKLSLEMSCYEIVFDILCLCKIKEDRDNLLLSLLDCDSVEFDSSEDIEVVLMTKISEIDEECNLMHQVMHIFDALIAAPDSVLRPYQQHFITEK